MKNLIFLILFVLITNNLFSQIKLLADSSYTSELDLIDNRQDTLFSDSSFYLTNTNDFVYEKESRIFIFFENENILISQDNLTLKKKYFFLKLVQENGIKNQKNINYITDSGDEFVLFYIDNKLVCVQMILNSENDYLRVFFSTMFLDTKTNQYIC